MRLSEWAERHFFLSAESSYTTQRWKCYPYQCAIMDCISNDEIHEVVLQKSARVGYTKILLAAIGYFAQHKRRNQALWQPTDEDADDFVKTELDHMLRDVGIMESVFPKFMQRDRSNTLRAKHFLGSVLHIRGGRAAKSYRRLTVDCAYIDELDGFELDIEKEGSPVSLSGKRIEGALWPKHVLGSTPKLKGFSMIEARRNQALSRLDFNIPCPGCEEFHAITWGGKDAQHGLKWGDGPPFDVRHVCPHCGLSITQQEYLAAASAGRWIDQNGAWIDEAGIFRDEAGAPIPTPSSVGFHVWTGYSPQATWDQIVREFYAAIAKARGGDRSELKTFTNTTLGMTWEEEVQKSDPLDLAARAEPYALRTCPDGVLILTAGVDVQDNRFEITVWGWGRGEESWVVDHTVLQADPANERDWVRLDDYLDSRFDHAGGGSLPIEAVAIDTGGHYTHQVYSYCRARSRRKIYAIKGDNQTGKPIKGRSSLQDVNYRGQIIKAGVRLWLVGTDTAKDLLFGRLKIAEPAPGYIHFSSDLPPTWFQQLTGEARVRVRTAKGEQWRWARKTPRVEALDCTIYAIFAAHMLDMPRYTEAMWSRLEARVGEAHRETAPAVVEPEAVSVGDTAPNKAPILPARPRPRGGFVNGWRF
jgi:phage terminase large subunit GpA-like protein